MRKLIGHIGVDSGQVLVTDPCYLKDFKNNEFNAKKFATIEYPDGKIEKVEMSFSDPKWEKVVDRINSKEIKIIKEEMEQKPRDYSYQGCCMASLSKEQAGEVEKGIGVCVSSGYGDGEYPVFAEYNQDGRIARMIVDFTEDENKED